MPGLIGKYQSANFAVRVLYGSMTISLRALVARFFDERPQVHVVAVNIRSPGDDGARVRKLLRLSAELHAE